MLIENQFILLHTNIRLLFAIQIIIQPTIFLSIEQMYS